MLVEHHHNQGIVEVCFDSPATLNALDEAMSSAFAEKIAQLRSDTSMRVLVLTGAGSSFSAGGNLDMLEAKRHKSLEQNRAEMLNFYRSFLSILELPVPVVGVFQGFSVGAGFCLASACDMRIGEQNAVFSAPFARLGIYPGMGGTHLIERACGSVATDLLLTGRRLYGAEALSCGFLHRLVAEGEGLKEALDWSQKLLGNAPTIIAKILKELRPDPQLLQSVLEREAELQAESYLGQEFQIGLEAVREKKKANYGGARL